MEGNDIHPTAIIHANAKLGRGNKIGRHVVIHDNVTIGNNNEIGDFSIIGGEPQHKSLPGKYGVVIGSSNKIREFFTIHSGIKRQTRIGNNNYIFTYAHMAHDACIGDFVTMCNNTQLSGHVVVCDYAVLSTSVCIEQFTVIGAFCFVGLGSAVSKNLPPFGKYIGNKRIGENSVGISRHAEKVTESYRSLEEHLFEELTQGQ